jgi:hypothetical protein
LAEHELDRAVLPLRASLAVGQRQDPDLGPVVRVTKHVDDSFQARKIATSTSTAPQTKGAYFLVNELPFDQIPNRFRVTRRDMERVAVILDGKDTPHRISRKFLRRVVKGPEALLGPREVADTSLRLVDITESPSDLRTARDNDTLAYIRRGETVNYSASADKLKGGIPAQRSNIRTRRPHWYTLNVPPAVPGRLAVPEHFDKRFIATALVGDAAERVVIDTCYVVELQEQHQDLMTAALNSLLTWYQIELRGRTQHGEGVLKVKIPDLRASTCLTRPS